MTHPFVILNRLPPCHPQPKAKRFGLGIQLDLDSRFHGNDGRGAGMTHLCHPQPKAKRFGLGIQLDLDSRFHGNDGSGAGMTSRSFA